MHNQVYNSQNSPARSASDGPVRVHKRVADAKRDGALSVTMGGSVKPGKQAGTAAPDFAAFTQMLALGNVASSSGASGVSAVTSAENEALKEENALLQDAMTKLKGIAGKFFELEIEEDELQTEVCVVTVETVMVG